MNVQPWTGTNSQENTGLPLPPNHSYWLMHHPTTCWDFVKHDNHWKFLPSFRRLFEMAGCNGVRMIPRGGTDSQMARVSMMDNGFEILDMGLGYQTRFPTKSGGYFYTDIWSTPKVVGRRVVWTFDEDGFNDWRNELLEDGILQKPDVDVLGMVIETQEKRVSRNAMRTHIPAVQKKYEEDQEILRLMKIYVETGKAVPIKTPKPKRVKKNV